MFMVLAEECIVVTTKELLEKSRRAYTIQKLKMEQRKDGVSYHRQRGRKHREKCLLCLSLIISHDENDASDNEQDNRERRRPITEKCIVEADFRQRSGKVRKDV